MASVEEFEVDISSRRMRTEEADLDITPMIDITFLLLAFFVVVSKMDAQVPVTMPKASTGTSIAEENCVIVVVTADEPGGDAKFYKGQSLDNSSVIDSEVASDIEAEIAEYIENEISRRPTVEAILIKGSGDVRAGDIETIKRGVASSELGLQRQVFFGVEDDR